MKQPRYSIIPAGAATDSRLEGRDLQVLCFLGCHTDRKGWCFLTQSAIADALKCGRSTVQRSLSRLIEAGWVEVRTWVVSSERPHACHAYRVIIDRDDEEEIIPEEDEAREQSGEVGCPPVGNLTPPDERLPARGQTSAHVYAGTEGPSKILSSGGDARARDPLVSKEAIEVAEQIAAIAGYPDPKAWPSGWCGAPMRVDAFLRQGYHPEHLLTAAREVMAGNPTAQAWSIGFFEKAFARTKARAEAPLPTAKTGGNDGAVQGGRVRQVGTGPDLRSAKERRWQQAWDNVDAALGLTRTDADRDGAQAHAALPRRLSESGGT